MAKTHIVFQVEQNNQSATMDIYLDGEDLTFVPRLGSQELLASALEEIINADYKDTFEIIQVQ